MNNRWFVPIILLAIIVIAGAMALGGAYLYQKSKAIPYRQTPIVTTQTSTATSGQAATPVALAEWKTYQNDKYGYAYKYPPSLTIKEADYPTHTFVDSGEVCKNLFEKDSEPRRLLNETTLIDPATKNNVAVVAVGVFDNAGNLSLDDWLNSGANFLAKHSVECQYDDKNYMEISLSNREDVTIDNTPAIEGFTGCCETSDKTIYFAKNGKIYNLTFSGDVNNAPIGKCDNGLAPFSDNKSSCPYISEDIYNQILSSFTLLNNSFRQK